MVVAMASQMAAGMGLFLRKRAMERMRKTPAVLGWSTWPKMR